MGTKWFSWRGKEEEKKSTEKAVSVPNDDYFVSLWLK
jgi:hypothetical protein